MDSQGESAEPSMSTADMLRKRHEAEEAHHATVEDVADEDDLQHPTRSSETPSIIIDNHDKEDASTAAKTAAKQGDAGTSDESSAPPKKKKPAESLDTASYEAFPQLGAVPQSGPPRQATTAWGSKKPQPPVSKTNGTSAAAASSGPRTQEQVTPSSAGSSRASTPTSSGIATPVSLHAAGNASAGLNSQRIVIPHTMSIPGRHSERISLLPREMKGRNQLKKPVADILREINRKSKAHVQMMSGAAGAIHFEAQGPVDAVRQALKEVAKELGSKQSIKVTVPASVRPHILGRQGTVIQSISKRTGAQIQLPKPAERGTTLGDENDDTMIDILIEGDSVAAAMARRDIENIVNERTSKISLKIRDVPAELYPFLAGPNNSNAATLEEGKDLHIHIPTYHTWRHQPLLHEASSSDLSHLIPSADLPILISGDRLAAQAAKAELERRAHELSRCLALSYLDLKKGQHQFVVGDRGVSPHEFLAETGCAVVLPPASHESETITIVGPPDKLDNAINKAAELALSLPSTDFDISRQHPSAPNGPATHARHITRYLQQRQEIDRLEKLYNAYIALPLAREGPSIWEIYSREGKNAMRARQDIASIVNAHPPARFSRMEIEPFYHRHLRSQLSQVLQSEHGVHLVFPDDDNNESHEIVLVYEGPAGSSPSYEVPKSRPTADEIQQFQRALGEAEKQVLNFIDPGQPILSRAIPAPKKFHDKLQRFVLREQQELAAGALPVQVQIGEPRLRRNQSQDTPSSLDSEVLLRGPANSVDALADKIAGFVAEELELERERGYTLTFDFPQKLSNHLIGRKGENVRKLREEFDVELQVQDGKVEVKGPKVKAEAARARIMALGKRLEDEASHVLKIHPQYHKDLIGSKGSQVHRLQDRYNVRITFPRNTAVRDDQSAADSASETGAAHPAHRSRQGQDEVIVKGPRKGADEARDELLNLLQWVIDNSHTATVSVAQNQIPQLIGQGGREMEKIRATTGAQVDIPDAKRDAPDSSSRVNIKLKGTKQQVQEAKQLLEERARTFDDTITKTVDIDRKYHKSLIGSGGATLRDIVTKAGGSEERRELARMVRFPGPESESRQIRVEGPRAVVEKIVAAFEDIVHQREGETVEVVDVPQAKHRFLIGRGGQTRRDLEAQFNISLDIPKVAENGAAPRNTVKIGGPRDAVAKAKAHILELIRNSDDATVQVPRRLHHVVADNGQFFRKLRNDFNVSVDHAGQQPPARPAAWNPQSGAAHDGAATAVAANMPLITDDDESAANAHMWQVRDNNAVAADGSAGGEGDGGGEIAWVLRGSPENVGRARDVLLKALDAAQKRPATATGYLVLDDPRKHRLVIGPQGSQVNAIRRATGCRINVPRDHGQGEAIEIVGERGKVEEAKNIILDVISRGGNGGDAPGRRRAQ